MPCCKVSVRRATVLYPESCTVYDVRVCDALGDFRTTQYRTDFEALWDEYRRFVAAVHEAVNRDYDLRDKDRWLWGKSFCQRLEADLASQLRNVREEDDKKPSPLTSPDVGEAAPPAGEPSHE